MTLLLEPRLLQEILSQCCCCLTLRVLKIESLTRGASFDPARTNIAAKKDCLEKEASCYPGMRAIIFPILILMGGKGKEGFSPINEFFGVSEKIHGSSFQFLFS